MFYAVAAKFLYIYSNKTVMLKNYRIICIALLAIVTAVGCKKKIKQQEDEIYSRHLQRHVKLTIISTPISDDTRDINLLLLNDGQDLEQFRVKAILDSLYRKKLVKPLVIVGIAAGDRTSEYGVAEMPG